MISKDSAKTAADELVSQARATSVQERNARALPQHPLYRFSELQVFQPWQRADVLRQCVGKADREWSVAAACFAWLACSAGAWIFIPSLSGHGAAAAFGFVFTLGLPFLFIRRAHVRHHLQELVNELPASAQPNHGQQR